jgi:hypothetical protein
VRSGLLGREFRAIGDSGQQAGVRLESGSKLTKLPLAVPGVQSPVERVGSDFGGQKGHGTGLVAPYTLRMSRDGY